MFELDNPEGIALAMAFIAWADQMLTPEERALLEQLGDAFNLEPSARAQFMAALEKQPSLDDVAAALTDEVERRFAVVQAIRMARADGNYSRIEHEHVAKLAKALNLDSELDSIMAEVVEADGRLLSAP